MAVPKKKNKKVKYKYSILKKQYVQKVQDSIIICIYCKLKKIELITSNLTSKKKICFICLNKLKKNKQRLNKKKKTYENKA